MRLDFDWDDSALVAMRLFVSCEHDLQAAVSKGRNGRRLLSIPELREDISACIAIDALDVSGLMNSDGSLRRSTNEGPPP